MRVLLVEDEPYSLLRDGGAHFAGGVRASDAPGGGALLTFTLPTLEMTAEETRGTALLNGAHRTPSSG